jgi:acylphosphatase
MPVPIHRQTCLFEGRVQGVGFRYTVQNLALQYDVKGFVRNLPDGRVELTMEGPEGDLCCLLNDIRQKMGCYIRRVQLSDGQPTGEFQGFRIRH